MCCREMSEINIEYKKSPTGTDVTPKVIRVVL